MKTAKIESSDSFKSSDEFEVPEGWAYKKLGEIVSPSKERIEPRADLDNPYIGLEHIESNTSKIIGHGVASEAKSTKTVFHSGDVLYGKLRPYLNKVAIPDFDGVCSTDILVFNQNQIIDSRYLMRYLSTRDVVEYANLKSKGISLPRVNFESLALIPVPLPPLIEQQRIVARVEALLTHVNAARDRLSRVPLIMKKFRQAVLAAACSGRLMDEPDGYESRPAGDLFKDARYGTSNKCDYTKERKIPVLRIPNIATGKLELTDLKYGNLTEKEIQRLAVQEGDLIICRTNGSLDLVGKAAIIPNLFEQFVFASYLIRVRVNRDLLLPEYYHICLTSQIGRDHIEEMARSTTGQFNLNLEILRSMPIPLPPLAEQHEIVRRVESLFERADAIEREVTEATKRTEALTQAVLAKGFSGNL